MKKIFPFLLLALGCSSQRPEYAALPKDPYVALGPYMDPTAALILSGVGLAAKPEYYRKNSISGKCVISGKETLVEIPCKENVQILLKDSNGKELARSTPYQGEFAFKVNKETVYMLSVEAKGFEIANENTKAGQGDQVILKLKKKKI